jgi:hypothetical protein
MPISNKCGCQSTEKKLATNQSQLTGQWRLTKNVNLELYGKGRGKVRVSTAKTAHTLALF